MCIRHETREKAHTHITYMLRQCTSIVYIYICTVILDNIETCLRKLHEQSEWHEKDQNRIDHIIIY
jgi:hypothetical protein